MANEKSTRALIFDPRVMVVLSLAAIVMVVTSPMPAALAALLMPLLGLIGRIEPLGRFWRWIRWVLPMVLFFGLVTAWSVSVDAGVLAATKLLGLTLVGHAFFIITPPEEVANAMVKAGLPYRVAFVVRAGLQFVPVLGHKAREVLDAQQARGIPIGGGWRALRYYPAFLVPLLVQSFQLAEELAEAMETRGFGRPGRTFFHTYTMRRRDWIAIMIGIAVSGGWVWGVLSWM